MIINDEKVGNYCDGVGCNILSCKEIKPHNPINCGYCVVTFPCIYPHRSGGCIKHPEVIVLDGVCAECYNGKNT